MAGMSMTSPDLARFAADRPDGPVLAVFKEDARSRVWSVRSGDGVIVIKQFTYSPVRQRLAMLLGCHPAQREVQVQRGMIDAGLPVVPIVATGQADGQLWLATAYVGESLQLRLKACNPTHAAMLIDAVATMTRRLIAAGWTFKDLKPSNVLVDDAGELWLIDVGSARRRATPAHIARMMGVMDRVLGRDGVSDELRRRYRDAISPTLA